MGFKPKTLNGRFALVALGFLGLLVSFSIYSYTLVSQSTSENYRNLHKVNELNAEIHAFTEIRHHLETVLHQYTAALTQEKLDSLLFHLEDAQQSAARLYNKKSIQEDPALYDKVSTLYQAVARLNQMVYEYVLTMQQVESRYPGMPILLGKMEPSNRRFSEAVELALQEAAFTDARPAQIAQQQYRIMQLFQEARYAWAMQISWFRVFVANRMGAFGEPEQAMQNNLQNRALFAANVNRLLLELEAMNKQGLLGIQQEESVRQMRDAAVEYSAAVKQAIAIYTSADWRADRTFISNKLQPILDKVTKISESITQQISQLNNRTIARSQSTARLLSKYILSFTAILITMMVGAYLVFQRHIRRPVLNLARRMQSDPLSGALKHSGFGDMQEIRQLVSAYDSMRNQVYNRQRRLQSILNNAAEGIITVDEYGRIETINTAAQRLFGYTALEVLGQKFSVLLMVPSSASEEAVLEKQLLLGQLTDIGSPREIRARCKDGREFLMSLKISEMTIGDKRLFTMIVDDITERRAAMERLQHMVEHDSLTGLHNRQYFNDILGHEFERSLREGGNVFACLYIDLDNFKYINDTMGHLQGDRLLKGIAAILRSRTRKTDILARLGGDEFALLITNVNQQRALQVAEDYRNAIATYEFKVNGKKVDAGCSVGVALFTQGLRDKEDLLARADLACHMAKREGRNRVYLFEIKDEDRIESFSEEMGWSRRIRDALQDNSFVFNCQPILQVKDQSIFSYELLLRMIDRKTGEHIMPSGFFDSAERFGLMPEIDRWVVEHAFEWIEHQPLHEPLNYFINLSGSSIGDRLLLETIRQSLQKRQIEAARIVFEITENTAIADLDKARKFLRELRELGFKTALDDFGVGYSSFSYLRELDVDYIKIDGSFINTMHTDELNYALVRAINDVCHILGKTTIAEFVQNQDSMQMLCDMGVDYAQGYNIARAEDYDQHTIEFRVAGLLV